MKSDNFDAFISFSMTDVNGQHSKSYFEAKRISRVMNELLGIKTYFCDKELSQREDKDFQKELMNRVANCELFVLILLDYADNSKPYFKSEREKFVEVHPDGNFIVLGTTDVIKRINNLDVIKNLTTNPDFFDLYDIASYQRFLNLVNNLAHKAGQEKIVDNIKVCKNCHKVFHDGNELNSHCVFHPGKLVYSKSHLTEPQFSCCNQKYRVENENEVVEISPGCCFLEKHVCESFD